MIAKYCDFLISYRCLNNCIFCSSYKPIKKFGAFPPLGFRKIKEALKRKKLEGYDHINFTGGEPTIHPYFLESLRLAKNLGLKVFVGSNGIKWADKNFCNKALPLVDEISLSLHGHNSKIHNLHTNNKESFQKLKQGLININQHPQNVLLIINIVVTKYNIDYLEEIIKFISQFKKVKQITISNIAPEGQASINFLKIAVRLTDLAARVKTIFELCNQKGITVRFFGIPICLLGEYKIYSNDIIWEPRLTLIRKKLKNNRIFLTEIKDSLPTKGRIFTTKCQRCIYKDVCGGIFKKYYQQFGDQELNPIYD